MNADTWEFLALRAQTKQCSIQLGVLWQKLIRTELPNLDDSNIRYVVTTGRQCRDTARNHYGLCAFARLACGTVTSCLFCGNLRKEFDEDDE